MKWVNHMLIGGVTTAVINPLLVPVAILGSTAPDWLETVANKGFGANWTHRQQTHYFLFWLVGTIFCAFTFSGWSSLITGFVYGGLTHLICDSLTVSGVPFSPWSNRRFHLFGGRLTTGSSGEYIVSGLVVVVSVFLINFTYSKNDFVPFFYRYDEMYNADLIDGVEWKQNRFKFF